MDPAHRGVLPNYLLHLRDDCAEENLAHCLLRVRDLLHRGHQAAPDHLPRVPLRLPHVPRRPHDLPVADQGHSQCQLHQEVLGDEGTADET